MMHHHGEIVIAQQVLYRCFIFVDIGKAKSIMYSASVSYLDGNPDNMAFFKPAEDSISTKIERSLKLTNPISS